MARDISGVLSSPDDPSDPFPGLPARRYLLGLHPLRYVIVHNALLDPPEQEKWRRLEAAPWARLVGRYGPDDLYRLSGDMTGTSFDKYFSWDYARNKGTVEFDARVSGPVEGDPWIDVGLNGHPLGRREIGAGWTHVALPLAGPRHHSAPNVVSIDFHYSGSAAPAARRRIGRTGVVSPVDLQVISAGMETGDDASIYVNARQLSPNLRGYNLVAIDPATGARLWSDDFDTFSSPQESDRLAQAIERLPAGTIVAAAVKDEASEALTDRAVAALRSLGGTADIRGRFRVSHLLIGVKGAAPGAAIEQSGNARLIATLGPPPEQVGVETRAFALR
jgi:hypothetical protein